MPVSFILADVLGGLPLMVGFVPPTAGAGWGARAACYQTSSTLRADTRQMGSRLRLLIGAVALVFVQAACATASRRPDSLERSDSVPRPPLRGASASFTTTRLRVAFPRIPLDSLGCGTLDSMPGEGTVRRFYFLASNRFPSSRYPDNHFMITGVNAYVSPTMKITSARLDSVLHVSELTVDEAAGEPPMNVRLIMPTFAVARYDGIRVVIDIAGEEAVKAFLAAGRESVSLSWCERGTTLSFLSVPLRRDRD